MMRESGIQRMIARLRRIRRKAPDVSREENRLLAEEVKGQVVKNLSGVPGMPQPVTRQYMNSYKVVEGRSSGGVSVFHVTSDADQADRLEYGFVGMDSAGRMVHQAPRPHRRPAVATVMAGKKKRQKRIIRRMIK